MTMASGFYGATLEDALDASNEPINLDGDSVKVVLVTDTYTPNFNTHTGYGSITNEITGTGYTATGQALTSPTWATASLYVPYDSADPAWTTSTFSAVRGAVGYDDTATTPVADCLLWATTFGADYAVTAGTFTIQVDANGWFRFKLT